MRFEIPVMFYFISGSSTVKITSQWTISSVVASYTSLQLVCKHKHSSSFMVDPESTL
jgi:hypothetical protein